MIGSVRRHAHILISAALLLVVPPARAEDVSVLLRAKTQAFSDASQAGNAEMLNPCCTTTSSSPTRTATSAARRTSWAAPRPLASRPT